MTKSEELIVEARRRYKDEDEVNVIPGGFVGISKIWEEKSDWHFRISPMDNDSYYYDDKNDTLCIWGRGIGLIYKQGVWATKKGEPAPVMELIYSIY